jgi:hypothetical protein
MELGFAAFKSGNLDVAEQHWRQAENIFPQDVRIQMNLRVLALRKQRER